MPLPCPYLHQWQRARALGRKFATDFADRTASPGKGEIALFRDLQRSLKSVANPPHVHVEEYHGANHQVMFAGKGSYSRTKARCELSDLLVVIFDQQTKDARLSYIQAKFERTVKATAAGVAKQQLASNLEQWDLLARRPLVTGVGSFQPPSNLLQSASLDSVGSFAFFLQKRIGHKPRGVVIQYSAASALQRPPQSVTRYGKLIVPHDRCCCSLTPECRSVYGNARFGAFLFGLIIGTPVLYKGQPVWGASSWLAAQLRGFSKQAHVADIDTSVATTLANLLEPNADTSTPQPNVGAASLLIFSLGSNNG